MDARGINLLGVLALAIADDFAERLDSWELPQGSSAAAIVSIEAYGGPSIETLSRVLGLTHSATVRLVDRLEAEGQVRRRKSGDRRSVALRLTAAGARMLGRLHEARRRAVERHVAVLQSDDQASLFRLVEKMLKLPRQAGEANHLCRLCDVSVCPTETCPVDCAVR